MGTLVAASEESPGWGQRVLKFLLRELHEIWPPTLFFFIGFNLILFTKRLYLQQYLIEYSGFFLATTGALIVGKAVLVTNAMPFLKRFDRRPLAYPILFKTVVYTAIVFIARLIEALVDYLVHSGTLGGGGWIEQLLGTFSWARFTATQLWIFVLFLLYVTASELNELLGDGELSKIFFKRPSTYLQSTRRKRIRLLSRLSRLTTDHSLEVIEDPHSPPHLELVEILRHLAQQP
jgi:hypothetical protein